MKARRIKFRGLRNNEWYQLFVEIQRLVERFGAEALNIVAAFAAFMAVFVMASDANLQVHKSAITALLNELDRRRDNIYRGLVAAVNSALHHVSMEKQEAAQRVKVLISALGNLASLPDTEETTALDKLADELEGKYAADVALLSLGEWITELRAANKAFADKVAERSTEVASRPKVRMVAVRRDVQNAYIAMTERVEALNLLNGDEKTTGFLTELNAILERYDKLIAGHGAGAVVADEEQEEESAK